MKIAILGTRGIPNHYGGFEQFAEHLSVGLIKRGHEVTVYNSHCHPYQEDSYNGVKIKHIYDPENKIGTAGQFVYDLLCIVDARRNDFDIVLHLGYTSSSIFFDFNPKNSLVVTNMDGLEWKRTKYSKKVRRFLQWAESLAAKKSDFLISDSVGIQKYLKEKYDENSAYIPYGSYVVEKYNENILEDYDVKKYKFDMLIARLEPENSIEIILNGVSGAEVKRKFLVVGNHETKYGRYLKDKFKDSKEIVFVGALYDMGKLNSLRKYSNIYFHGHTVGGTNPSLLEAMGSNALICANDNEFNSAILGGDAFYFKTGKDVSKIIDTIIKYEFYKYVESNVKKIENIYEWEAVIDQYDNFFVNINSSRKLPI